MFLLLNPAAIFWECTARINDKGSVSREGLNRMAQYRCVADCYVSPGGYAFASDILADDGTPGSIAIPVGYLPPVGAVDPITADAIQNVWNVGPVFGPVSSAQPGLWNSPHGWFRWTGVSYPKPRYYWRPIGGGQFVLNGAENLGPRSG
jgi:hypothetical protein